MLKKGDPCYVRLSGLIVRAIYEERAGDKHHFVKIPDGRYAITTSTPYDDDDFSIPDCRFVCMTGMRKEYVESLS